MASGDIYDTRKLLRKILFVAPSMRVLDLLLQMRMERIHMALVVDEYGGIDGLTTIEDLVEQIVGEIEDEHDVDEGPLLTSRSDGTYDVDARLGLGEFEETIGQILTEEEREDGSETVGGLIFNLAGRVPTRGEVIWHEASGIEFEIIDADARRIRRGHRRSGLGNGVRREVSRPLQSSLNGDSDCARESRSVGLVCTVGELHRQGVRSGR